MFVVRSYPVGLLMVLAPGCSLEQANPELETLGDVQVDTGEPEVSETTSGGVTGAPDDDQGAVDSGGADVDSGADDSPGGCVDENDCPAGDQCVGGLCIGQTCTEGQPCDPPQLCRAGAITCAEAEPQCVEIGPGPPGVVCGEASVCDELGACVPCMNGAVCQPKGECLLGSITCGDGQPECTMTGWVPEGTSCEGGRFCNDMGVCRPVASCLQIHTLDPLLPSGVYPVDLDGPGGDGPLDVYCDMLTDGGGWTLWPDGAMNDLGDNAGMPRCSAAAASECYAGTFAGRGDAVGLFVVADQTAEQLQPDLTWSAVGTTSNMIPACDDSNDSCAGGVGLCLFALEGDGTDCCTEPVSNMCLE